ncbi:hypothetical protein BSFA1_79770 (plasmid) [Burkholderia sp. SFA1]|nr:hypothetical protein BYI23_E000840 [Burkholderia sp. YI23]BBQ02849.1 hypothetical protein BSFA1_79770 [Burkholderia sp. SFA1]
MTEKRLSSISVPSASIHAALLMFLLSYPSVALMRFLQHFDPQRASVADAGPWWATWLLLPVALGLGGAIWAALACLAYNAIAKMLGGVRYRA